MTYLLQCIKGFEKQAHTVVPVTSGPLKQWNTANNGQNRLALTSFSGKSP